MQKAVSTYIGIIGEDVFIGIRASSNNKAQYLCAELFKVAHKKELPQDLSLTDIAYWVVAYKTDRTGSLTTSDIIKILNKDIGR